MSETKEEKSYVTCCDLCGNPPLLRSGLCARCHARLSGENSLGVAFRRVKPAQVTVRGA